MFFKYFFLYLALGIIIPLCSIATFLLVKLYFFIKSSNENLDLIEKKKANYISQNNNEATYARKIDKSEAKIKWDQDARKILAQINALYPNPGCWFDLNGVRIKIIKAIEVRKQGKAGEVLSDNFTIACLKNAIQILEIQKEGKNKVSSKEFLKGNKLEKGLNLL